jgi:hypothetical protein
MSSLLLKRFSHEWKTVGVRYEGEIHNKQLHGHGVCVWAHGQVFYNGSICNTYQRYDGEWSDGKKHGRGAYSWPGGTTCDAVFADGLPHGFGKMTCEDGSRYEGEFLAGRRHGKGVFTWACGAKYDGEFWNDERHGHGVETEPDGCRYEGEYRYNKKHGQGVFIWPDGARYDGEYCDDKREGKGKVTLPDGTYVGEHKADHWHGRGIYIASNLAHKPKRARVKDGLWEHGQFVIDCSTDTAEISFLPLFTACS